MGDSIVCRSDSRLHVVGLSCRLDAMASVVRKSAPGSFPGLTLATLNVAGALLQASAAIHNRIHNAIHKLYGDEVASSLGVRQ